MFENKMRLILLFVLVISFWSSSVNAQSGSLNLAIPQSPQSFQSDRVRAGDVECSAAIGSSTNLEFGVVGIMDQNDPWDQYRTGNGSFVDPNRVLLPYNDDFMRNVGVYARITVPIGAPKERLNCNALYKLELEKKRLEVMRLQQEIVNLRKLKFEE
jgi:hypothetical protein